MATLGTVWSTAYITLIFFLLKSINGSFVCDNQAPKQFRRFAGPKTIKPVRIPDLSLTSLLDEEQDPIEYGRRSLHIKWGQGNAQNFIRTGLSTASDFILNTTDSTITVEKFETKFIKFGKFNEGRTRIRIDIDGLFKDFLPRQSSQCKDSDIYFIRRLRDLTGTRIKLIDIRKNFQELVNLGDEDLVALALIQREIQPFTAAGLVEYIKWMTETNNIRLPFVVRFAQKVMGLLDMEYGHFKDNFAAIVSNLIKARGHRITVTIPHLSDDHPDSEMWTLNLAKLPRPMAARMFNFIPEKLRVISTIHQFIKHLTKMKKTILNAFADIGISLIINPFSIFSQVHELITQKIDNIKIIIKWMISERLLSLENFLERLRTILLSDDSASVKIKTAILEFLAMIFNIPLQGRPAFNHIIISLVTEPDTPIQIPIEDRPTETKTKEEIIVKETPEPEKPKELTKEEIEEKYFNLLVTFMTKLLTTELNDKFAVRLRVAIDVDPAIIQEALPKQRSEYSQRFSGFLKWLQDTIDYRQPDFELFLKKFKTVYSDNLDIRFLLVDLAKRKPNKRVESITSYTLQLLNELGKHEVSEDPLVTYLQSVFKVSKNIEDTVPNTQSLHLFISELLMVDPIESYESFKTALKQLFTTKSLSAEYFVKLLASIFDLKLPQDSILEILSKLQHTILELTKRPESDIEAYKNLIHLIRFVFCQIQNEKSAVLVTNLQYLFIENKQIEFFTVLENLSKLFLDGNTDLDKLLIYLNTELGANKDYLKLIHKLSDNVKNDDTTILTHFLNILKNIFNNSAINVDETALKLKEAIITNDYHIFEIEFKTQILSLSSMIDQLYNNPNGYFKKALEAFQSHLGVRLSQQELVQKLSSYAELNDESYRVASQWFSQFYGGDLNQRVILALINLNEVYQRGKDNDLLSHLAVLLRDLFELKLKYTVEEFKEVFNNAVAGIVVTRVKIPGGESVKVTFRIKAPKFI